MFVIGITGGICAGKSSVVQVLRQLGVEVLDADKLGHKAYEPGTACFDQLVAHFGDRVVENGQINRRVLGSIVFSDASEMTALQGIVWPEIRRLLTESLAILQAQGTSVVALEAAVMIEAKWYDLASCLWVVTVSREVALQRLVVRNSLSEEEAAKRIDSQISNEERCAHATLVIDNNSRTIAELEDLVKDAYHKLPCHAPSV
jgi:phosphopantetheine adenylyltransferase/dephospho-CoA kinase